MVERVAPPSFELRRAQMVTAIDQKMYYHPNIRFRLGWSLKPYHAQTINGVSYRAFHPESITAVRKAASIALAVETKPELLEQAQQYTLMKLPDDKEKARVIKQSIQKLNTQIDLVLPDDIPLSVDLRKQFGKQFAKIELASNTASLDQTKEEMHGYVPSLENQLLFVVGMTSILIGEILDVSTDNSPEQPLSETHPLRSEAPTLDLTNT